MAKKKHTKDKESLNASITYEGDGELISDISSSQPLKNTKKKTTKKTTKKTSKEKAIKPIVKEVEIIREKTQKEIYNDILISGEDFVMKYCGSIIYDSNKDKNKILVFNNNGFILEKDEFLYSGLSIKFKK